MAKLSLVGINGAGPGMGGASPKSATFCPVRIATIIACKIVYMSGFAEIKHETRGKWDLSSFSKRKLQTYIYIRHVGRSLLLVLLKGLVKVLISGIYDRLESRLQFHKQ